jgi:hypothetical protein
MYHCPQPVEAVTRQLSLALFTDAKLDLAVARLVPRDHDDAGTHFGECFCRYVANPGRGAS